MGQNIRSEVNLLGDCGLNVAQLTEIIKKDSWTFKNEEWWDALNAKVIYFHFFI